MEIAIRYTDYSRILKLTAFWGNVGLPTEEQSKDLIKSLNRLFSYPCIKQNI